MNTKNIIFGLSLFSLSAGIAQAVVTVTISEVGSNVVAVASGSANVDGLTYLSAYSGSAFIRSSAAAFFIGDGNMKYYSIPGVVGPATMGTGTALITASSGTGSPVFLDAANKYFGVPGDYTSGNTISGSATWNSTTVAALGLTQGTYTWTWGSGANADSLEVTIVPEPSTYAVIVGVFAFGFIALHRRRR